MYFRLRLIGYFEGIDAERGIAWRANDWLVRATLDDDNFSVPHPQFRVLDINLRKD